MNLVTFTKDTHLMDEYGRPMVAVPAWLFGDLDPTCNRYLLRIEGSQVHPDGGHTDVQDVAKARHLVENLNCITKQPSRRYVMITIEEVSELIGSVNQEAIDTLNS